MRADVTLSLAVYPLGMVVSSSIHLLAIIIISFSSLWLRKILLGMYLIMYSFVYLLTDIYAGPFNCE